MRPVLCAVQKKGNNIPDQQKTGQENECTEKPSTKSEYREGDLRRCHAAEKKTVDEMVL